MKKLKYLHMYMKRIGHSARTACEYVKQAVQAMESKCPSGPGYQNIRHIVSGAVPDWDDRGDEHDGKHNSAVACIIVGIQNLYST